MYLERLRVKVKRLKSGKAKGETLTCPRYVACALRPNQLLGGAVETRHALSVLLNEIGRFSGLSRISPD
jgi:hypothetical protein